MKANPVINPATGASGDVIVDASQADKVYVFTNTNALGAAESVTASLPNTVSNSGAVSPVARAMASITPVAMPGSAVGKTIETIVRQRVMPSA